MKKHYSYISTELAEAHPDYIKETIHHNGSVLLVRVKDFSVINITKLLFQFKSGPIRYTELWKNSKFRMKLSFFNYLNYCIDKKLIDKRRVTRYEYEQTIAHSQYIRKRYSHKLSHKLYYITDKGRSFLELI